LQLCDPRGGGCRGHKQLLRDVTEAAVTVVTATAVTAAVVSVAVFVVTVSVGSCWSRALWGHCSRVDEVVQRSRHVVKEDAQL
jgi:hypothetical protein